MGFGVWFCLLGARDSFVIVAAVLWAGICVGGFVGVCCFTLGLVGWVAAVCIERLGSLLCGC